MICDSLLEVWDGACRGADPGQASISQVPVHSKICSFRGVPKLGRNRNLNFGRARLLPCQPHLIHHSTEHPFLHRQKKTTPPQSRRSSGEDVPELRENRKAGEISGKHKSGGSGGGLESWILNPRSHLDDPKIPRAPVGFKMRALSALTSSSTPIPKLGTSRLTSSLIEDPITKGPSVTPTEVILDLTIPQTQIGPPEPSVTKPKS